MPPPAEGPEVASPHAFARRASRAPLPVLSAEEMLAAVGCRHADAVVCAALPSRGIAALAATPTLSALVNLSDLDLSGNALHDLSPLAALPWLRRLNAAGNCLALPWAAPQAAGAGSGSGGSTHVPAGWFVSLESLDLSYNQLQPEALLLLAGLPRLQELDVSGNALVVLPPLPPGAFPALRRLAARHNELGGGALAALAHLPLLQQLIMHHNCVAHLPPLAPAALARVELLDLSHNRLADVADVARLQRLPSIQRLLLAGCPVARAGFGAAGTLAGTLHQAASGAGRRGAGGLGAGGGRAGRPSLALTFQFSAVVEEASAVSLRAKALARRGSAAGSAGGTCSMDTSASCSACPTRPGSGSPAEGRSGSAPASALQPGEAAMGSAPDGAVAGHEGAAAAPSATPAAAAAEAGPFIGWEVEEEEEEEGEEEEGGAQQSQAVGWSTASADGTSGTAETAALHLGGCGSEDPTLRLALALGLDPLQLPAAGGPGIAGSPAAAIKALRFALAHPSSAPSLAASSAAGSGHHLAMTASVLAKQRRKAGQAAQPGYGGSLEGRRARVQAIDGLLAAMKRRLRAVQAAMAEDAAQARQQETEAGQHTEEPAAEGASGDVGSGEHQAAGSDAAPDGPILLLSASGKHTQVHDLLVNVLAGGSPETTTQLAGAAADGGVGSPAPSTRGVAQAGPASPWVKRPSVVAAELHAFADALRERQ